MVVNGYKRALVQEDMWELSEADSTDHISQHFQRTMQLELSAARAKYEKRLRKRGGKLWENTQEEDFQNSHHNSLGKGVSKDILMMVGRAGKKHFQSTGCSDW